MSDKELIIDDKELTGTMNIENVDGELVGVNPDTGERWDDIEATSLFDMIVHDDTKIRVIDHD